MPKNRKKSAANNLLNRILLLALGLLFCVGGLGLAVVNLRHKVSDTANRIRIVEKNIAYEQRKLAKLGAQISEAMSTDKLIDKNDDLALKLAPPRQSQLVIVSLDVEDRLSRKTVGGLLSSNFNASE